MNTPPMAKNVRSGTDNPGDDLYSCIVMPGRVERILGHAGHHREPGAAARPAGRKFLGGLTFKELAKRTWREGNEDNAFDHAAALAYYFMLAFFPLLIFLISLLGLMPSAQDRLLDY